MNNFLSNEHVMSIRHEMFFHKNQGKNHFGNHIFCKRTRQESRYTIVSHLNTK